MILNDPWSSMSKSETQPPNAESASATDPDALARLRRFGGDKLVREMIDLYLTTAPERLAAARNGASSGDLPSTELALHSLKSSSAQLGAIRVGKLSERGELIARTGTLDGIPDLVVEMEDELARAAEWLTRVRDGGAA